jgi:predicted acetyltransferase
MLHRPDPLNIAVVPVTPEDAPVLERLWQLSAYDYSTYGGTDVDASGVFPTPVPDEQFFFVRVGGHFAGFASVIRHASYLGHGEVHLLSYFFVMPKYRRRGVGEHVARTLFDRFPGRWEVATNPGREPAQTFWRRVVGRYTGGTHQEAAAGCERWDGPIWAFESKSNGTAR